MRKVLFRVMAVALMIGVLAGAGVSTAAELPKIIAIATMPVGTTVNMQGSGISVLINSHSPMKARVTPMGNENSWIPMLQAGEVELGVGNQPEVEAAYVGKGAWKNICKRMGVKGFPVRIVALGQKVYVSFNVCGDSSYHKIHDLKGARVCQYPRGTAFGNYTLAFLANGGLTAKDVKLVPVSNPLEAGRGLMDGRLDAALVLPDAPIIMEMVTKVGARFLPLTPSPEAVARMKAIDHELRVEVPEVTYPHVLEKKQPMGVFDVGLFSSEKVPANVIYEVAKVLYENAADLKKKPGLERWHRKQFCSKKVYVPYHEGAIKFYKEKGLWNAEMEKRQQKLLAEQPK